MRVPLEWLREFVEIRLSPEKLAHLLTMSGLEVESVERMGKDAVFEINVTPNRADCLSIAGVAREVAALTGARLKSRPPKPVRGSGRMAERAKVQVRQKARCPRYTARVIEGVAVKASPPWLAARLAACGVRSINNIVDATNYVMLELGQPLHAFDLNRLRGRAIVVDAAAAGARFTALDGISRELTAEDLMICDGERPVALAGIMGGENSEVSERTTSLLLESACFAPSGVRRSARRLGLSTESSRRFERGVDPNGVLAALQRLTELIVQLAGGTPTADCVDLYPKKALPARISLSAEEVNRILGTKLTIQQVARLLSRLQLKPGAPRGGRIAVAVPTFRPDLTRPIDLIEEVARLHGYGRIGETKPCQRMEPIVRPRFAELECQVRDAMVGAGMDETVLLGFTSAQKLTPFAGLGPNPVAIENPLSQDEGVMCTTLLPGLLDAAKLNASRQRPDVRLYALQRVFHRPGATGPSEEPRTLSGLLTGKRFPNGWERSRETVDFYDAKGAVETALASMGIAAETIFQRGNAPSFLHPGHFAYVIVGGQRVGFVGQLHPEVTAAWDLKEEVFVFELHFELMAERAQALSPRFQGLSRFPFATRDIAILVDDRIPLVEIEKTISDSGIKLLDDVRLFDFYRGKGIPEGRKSLALTLRFSREDRTITDDEVVGALERIVGDLKAKLGATLRE